MAFTSAAAVLSRSLGSCALLQPVAPAVSSRAAAAGRLRCLASWGAVGCSINCCVDRDRALAYASPSQAIRAGERQGWSALYPRSTTARWCASTADGGAPQGGEILVNGTGQRRAEEAPRCRQRQWNPEFAMTLPEGTCVGLRLLPFDAASCPSAASVRDNPNHWIRRYLHPDEVSFGVNAISSDGARSSFYAGRLAMRAALHAATGEQGSEDRNASNGRQVVSPLVPDPPPLDLSGSTPILRDEHGRPGGLPAGFLGSISHKRGMGVALVCRGDDRIGDRPKMGVGVDLEEINLQRAGVAKRVLTERELKDLGQIKGISRDEEVLLRFSLKESVYKAMHPLICQYVGFQEAEAKPLEDGSARIWLNLKSRAHERFDCVTAHWRRLGDKLFLSSASVTLKEDKEDKAKHVS